jgi:hypothetical protein
MPFDWKGVQGQVVSGVVVAIVLGGGSLIWNWGSSGGLVRALGGVTVQQLAEEIAKHPGRPGPKGDAGPPGAPGPKGDQGPVGEAARLPWGAVVAFDRSDLDDDRCLPGWSPYREARARTIVGAGDPNKARGQGIDELGHRMRSYSLLEKGGVQVWTELHENKDPVNAQHSNMIPYIALFYCVKNQQ